MRIYDYTCERGHRFEALVASADSPDPTCGTCGASAHRRPSAARLGSIADPGPSREDMPKSWTSTGCGDPETLRHWHDQMTKREALEEKHPELAGDRRPVIAHEGQFAGNPLRAGDPLPSAPSSRSSSPRGTDAS